MNVNLYYNILNINIKQFALFNGNIDSNNFEMRINNAYSYGIDVLEKILTCIITIEIRQQDDLILKIETQATYSLSDAAISKFVSNKIFTMPEEDVRAVTDILYGATRGILVCKLEGSPMASFVLPTIDLNKVINKPLEIILH